MSPTAFKQHVTHLTGVFKRCDDLCDAVFEHRRVGSKHEALDRLQLGVRGSQQTIQGEYTALRKVFGSRFDLGDDFSRESVKSSIRTMEEIERKLSDIANRRNQGTPGFRDMLKIVKRVEDEVTDTLVDLGQRLDHPPTPVEKKTEEKKKKEKKEEKKPKKVDEVIISIKEFDRYVDHLKNSWSESLVAGRILYVNAFDESKNTWDRPRSGFIRELPQPAARPVYEVPRPRAPSPLRRQGSFERRSPRPGW